MYNFVNIFEDFLDLEYAGGQRDMDVPVLANVLFMHVVQIMHNTGYFVRKTSSFTLVFPGTEECLIEAATVGMLVPTCKFGIQIL
jgi:hypothetical protein